jgi:gas vesicle protein
MGFVIGLIIGLIIGAAILYVTQRSKLSSLETKLRQTRRELDKIEADFQAQMQETISYLRHAYDRESTQKSEATAQQYQKEIRALKQNHQLEIHKLQAEIDTQIPTPHTDPTRTTTESFTTIEKSIEEDSEFPFDALNDSFFDEPEQDTLLATPVEELPSFFPEELETDDATQNLAPLAEAEEPHPLAELAAFLETKPQLAFDSSSVTTNPRQNSEQSTEIELVRSLESVDQVVQLGEYIYNRDAQIRATVAENIGKIAESGSIKRQIRQIVPILAKLIHDNDVYVRRSTAACLGKVQSEQVLPLIRLALRDSDPEVVKLASSAIDRFRVYPHSQKPGKKKNQIKK